MNRNGDTHHGDCSRHETGGEKQAILRIAMTMERRQGARAVIRRSERWAFALGVLPFPLIDIAGVSALLMKMIRQLAELYEVPCSGSEVKRVATAVVGASLPTSLGFGAATLSKCIPVVGLVVGLTSTPLSLGAATRFIGLRLVDHFEAGGTLDDFDAKLLWETTTASSSATVGDSGVTTSTGPASAPPENPPATPEASGSGCADHPPVTGEQAADMAHGEPQARDPLDRVSTTSDDTLPDVPDGSSHGKVVVDTQDAHTCATSSVDVQGRAKPDDLTRVAGIGPKIGQVLVAEGIETYAALASTSVQTLLTILDRAGRYYRIHDPTTWPQQAQALLNLKP